MERWFIALGDKYSSPMCIFAAPVDVMLATHLGFKESTVVEISGHERHQENMRLWLGIRQCSNRNRSGQRGPDGCTDVEERSIGSLSK